MTSCSNGAENQRFRGLCCLHLHGQGADILHHYPEDCTFNLLTSYFHGAGVVLENLIVTQLVHEFPSFYGTLRFITVPTRDRHRSPFLNHVSAVHNFPTYISNNHSNIMLPSTSRLRAVMAQSV